MSNELNYLLSRAAKGLMSRREFVGRAGALGVSAALASSLLASAARAEEPKKGGLLRAGMQGARAPTRWTRHWRHQRCRLRST